jgi:ribosomal protein S18 acetylase RimI-like enzyme
MDDLGNIRIRRASPDDVQALTSLAARLFRETYRDDVPAADLDAFIADGFGEAQQARELADPETVTLLVEHDGEAVGYAQVRRRPLPASVSRAPIDGDGGDRPGETAPEAELLRLYLDRRYHGRGIAHPVLREAARFAGDFGARTMWVGVWERNARAVAFYARRGFRQVGTQEFQVGGESHRDLVMATEVVALLR